MQVLQTSSQGPAAFSVGSHSWKGVWAGLEGGKMLQRKLPKNLLEQRNKATGREAEGKEKSE